MKRTLKSILAVALCLTMLIGIIAIGSTSTANFFEAIGLNAYATTYSVGDIIEFGTYPQSKVTDNETIAALNNCSGTWVSYGYYSGTGWDDSMVASDYMRFKDVSYNGNKYRAVTFDTFRPCWTQDRSSTSCTTYQDDNGYYCGNTYWFRYEALKWRVLDPSTGLVMCITAIDSQPYNNYLTSEGQDAYGETAYWGSPEKTYYMNNYAESSIRKWLNDDFYNTAFSEDQKSSILTTTINNNSFISTYSDYNSASTSDKVYLLSWNDILNSKYGFCASTDSGDSAKMVEGSDYAQSQGLRVYSLPYSDAYSGWFLRTAGDSSYATCRVYPDGCPVSHCYDYYNNFTFLGVVPAMRLQNINSSSSYSETFTSNGNGTHVYIKPDGSMTTEKCSYKTETTADCTKDGTTTYTCISCGYTYSEKAIAIGHKDVNNDNICDTCGSAISTYSNDLVKVKNATIKVPSGKTIGWNFKAKMTAIADLPIGYHLAWYEGGNCICNDATYTTGSLTSQHTYTAKIVDSNGNVVSSDSQNKSVTVSVKTGFFDKIISFFQRLFGSDVTTL